MTIEPHSDRLKFARRLEALDAGFVGGFSGVLFRMTNPRYAKGADIVNGAGALHASGRWNLAGEFRLSYTTLDPETALAEALAHSRYFRLPPGTALPRTLVALRLEAGRVLDLRNGGLRNVMKLSEETITALDWRAENRKGREAVTQAWGRAFAAAGIEAVVAPSAAEKNGVNVLVYPENLQSGSRFELESEKQGPESQPAKLQD